MVCKGHKEKMRYERGEKEKNGITLGFRRSSQVFLFMFHCKIYDQGMMMDDGLNGGFFFRVFQNCKHTYKYYNLPSV